MANNKGVYLNDIPLDLFFKYFVKDDLEDRELSPSLINDNKIFFKYDITISGDDYEYYSAFSKDTTITELQEEILLNFSDLYPNIILSDITNISYIESGGNRVTLSTDAFISSKSTLLINKYGFTNSGNNSVNDFLLINDTLNYNLVNSVNGVSLKDLRTSEEIFEDSLSVNLVIKDKGKQSEHFEVFKGTELVGYIKSNSNSVIQERDSNGNLIFINESGNKTTDFIRNSIFLRHNRAFRKGIFKLENPVDIISLRFKQKVAGIYKEGQSLKLSFYQNFLRKIKYEKVNIGSNSFSVEHIPTLIKQSILTNVDLEYETNIVESKVKEIADISRFRRIEVIEKTGSASTFITISERDLFIQNEPVLLDVYKRQLNFENSLYDINSSNLVSLGSGDLANLKIIRKNNGIDYVRLPVILSEGKKIIPLPGNRRLELLSTSNGNIQYFVFKSISYFLETDSSDTVRYPNGFISAEADIQFNLKETIIGVSSTSGSETLLVRYSPIVSEIEFDENFFQDTSEFTESSGIFTRERYIRDEKDTEFFLKITETVEKQSSPAIPEIKEFIDYNHTIVSSGEDFTTLSGLKIKRGLAVNTYMTLSSFIGKFSNFEHLASNRYYESRGALVRDDYIKEEKKKTIISMITEYMGFNSNFYASVGLFYGANSFMKMRIVSEAFFNVISFMKTRDEDNILNLSLTFDNLKKNIIFYKLDNAINFDSKFKIRDYIDDSFLEQRLEALRESSKLNSFQKLLDYKEIPYTQKRLNYLYEQKKREKIFLEATSSERAKDVLELIEKKFKDNTVTKLEFKNSLISLISGFFFESNTYEENDYYVTSFYKYYKDKLSKSSEISSIPFFDNVNYKSVILKSDLKTTGNYNSLLEKIFSNDEDWRII
jgi:hypothetical protein